MNQFTGSVPNVFFRNCSCRRFRATEPQAIDCDTKRIERERERERETAVAGFFDHHRSLSAMSVITRSESNNGKIKASSRGGGVKKPTKIGLKLVEKIPFHYGHFLVPLF